MPVRYGGFLRLPHLSLLCRGGRADGKTLNYLYTIAGNLCKDYLKKTKEILLEENESLEGNQAEENQTEQILNRVLIEQVLGQLPDESREVLTLYYFQELKLTEISGKLQIGLTKKRR